MGPGGHPTPLGGPNACSDASHRLSAMTGEWPLGDQLNLYLERVADLLSRRVIRDQTLGYQFSMKWNRDTGGQMGFTGQPDEEDLRSFLLSFRHFIANDEPVYVNRIQNLLWQQIEADQVREGLKEAKAHWQRACSAGAVALNINGVNMASEDLLDLWINGVYFHSDQRKRARLEQLGPMVGMVSRFKLLDHLIVATNYIVYLRNVIVRARSDGLLRL